MTIVVTHIIINLGLDFMVALPSAGNDLQLEAFSLSSPHVWTCRAVSRETAGSQGIAVICLPALWTEMKKSGS
jgi:hypothetical protein